MIEILHYDNRKIGPILWDASTPEKKANALLSLFNMLDRDWGFYDSMEERDEGISLEQYRRLLDYRNGARCGNANAAELLLRARRDYEYEFWMFIEVVQT